MRPENWAEISNKAVTELKRKGIDFNPACFIAGADAMLEALKKKGIKADNIRDLRYPESDVLTIPTIERMKEMQEIEGVWVFIPEEEK